MLCCFLPLPPRLEKKRVQSGSTAFQQWREKNQQNIEGQAFYQISVYQIHLATKELCERKKSHNSGKNPKDLSFDKQSASGPQASVVILPLAHSQKCFGTASCLTYAQMSCRCCAQMGNVSLETTYSHIL